MDIFMTILKARVGSTVEGEQISDLYNKTSWIIFEDAGTLLEVLQKCATVSLTASIGNEVADFAEESSKSL